MINQNNPPSSPNNELIYVEQVLGFFPNTIGFGFAYFREVQELTDYGMVRISPMSNEKCLERMIKIIKKHNPSVIVLPAHKGKLNLKSRRVQNLINKISTYAQKNEIVIHHYSRDRIRFAFEDFKVVTKHEIAGQIAKFFPHLQRVLPPKPKCYIPEKYYQGMFDAISLALTHNFLSIENVI